MVLNTAYLKTNQYAVVHVTGGFSLPLIWAKPTNHLSPKQESQGQNTGFQTYC